MSNDDRITSLAQSIYIARHNQKNGATGSDLTDFQDQTIEWINQFIPEFEKEADWNFVRTNDDPSLGTVTSGTTISYPLPATIRKLVVNARRDLTLKQGGTTIFTFAVVNPNQIVDPRYPDVRDRATVMNRKLIFSRSLNPTEIGATIVADTIAFLPLLSHADVSLLDILDANRDIRQLFVLGVLKNQTMPDIVQGGLSPSFAQKYNDLLQECVTENNISADADDQDRENFAFIGGIGWQ